MLSTLSDKTVADWAISSDWLPLDVVCLVIFHFFSLTPPPSIISANVVTLSNIQYLFRCPRLCGLTFRSKNDFVKNMLFSRQSFNVLDLSSIVIFCSSIYFHRCVIYDGVSIGWMVKYSPTNKGSPVSISTLFFSHNLRSRFPHLDAFLCAWLA